MSMILVTGATGGIGLETAMQLARQGHELVLHGRSAEKAGIARDTVLRSAPDAEIHIAHADLADLAAVAKMAENLCSNLHRLDVLVNNAGVYMTECKLSKDGFEMSIAVNYLAHFLLTAQLLPLLKKSPEPRVVSVSSAVHMGGRIDFSRLNCEQRFDPYAAYANSKLANAVFAAELARREPWLTSNSLHPGVVDTKLLHAGFDMTGGRVEAGARTSVFLATSPEAKGISGKYFDNCRVAAAAASVNDMQLAQQLWRWSANAVALKQD